LAIFPLTILLLAETADFHGRPAVVLRHVGMVAAALAA
jgi:hypothetical protein